MAELIGGLIAISATFVPSLTPVHGDHVYEESTGRFTNTRFGEFHPFIQVMIPQMNNLMDLNYNSNI